MKMDAHPARSTRNFGVHRSGKSANEPGDKRRTRMLLLRTIISFNMSEDIEASEREISLMKQPEAVSYLERLRVSSARVECRASASLSLGRSHSTYFCRAPEPDTSFRFAEAAEAPQQTLVGIAAGLIKDLCLFVLKTLLNSFVTPQPIPCLY